MFSFPGVTLSALINFDGLTVGTVIDGTNLGGVTINTLGGGQTVVVDDFGVGYRSAPNSITNFGPSSSFDDFLTTYDMVFVFDAVVNFVSFTGGDVGGDFDQFSVDLYDSSNNLLLTFTTPTFGGNSIDPQVMVDFYTFQASLEGIKRMVVRDAINAGIGIDDLEFRASVPEPATMLLLGVGLLGIAGFSRRKFKTD
jgi:hypothetical protein